MDFKNGFKSVVLKAALPAHHVRHQVVDEGVVWLIAVEVSHGLRQVLVHHPHPMHLVKNSLCSRVGLVRHLLIVGVHVLPLPRRDRKLNGLAVVPFDVFLDLR